MEKLRVRVTIDEFAIPGNRGHCAIANALKVADPDILNPRADENVITYRRRSNGTSYIHMTPRRAAEFIREFDRKIKDPSAHVNPKLLAPFFLNLSEQTLMETRAVAPDRNREVQRQKRKALKNAPDPVKAARPSVTAAVTTKKVTKSTAGAVPKKTATTGEGASQKVTPRRHWSPTWRI